MKKSDKTNSTKPKTKSGISPFNWSKSAASTNRIIDQGSTISDVSMIE